MARIKDRFPDPVLPSSLTSTMSSKASSDIEDPMTSSQVEPPPLTLEEALQELSILRRTLAQRDAEVAKMEEAHEAAMFKAKVCPYTQ